MLSKWVIILGPLLLYSPFAYSDSIKSNVQPSPRLIAKASHMCGERRYEVNGTSLTTADEAAVRDIISFLYEGANILFKYPGAPAQELNDETRKSMAKNSYIHDVELKNIPNPSQQQVDEAVQKLYSLDPLAWNIHKGPSHEQIKKILADPKFSNHLGSQTVKLIESRLNGVMGQRQVVFDEISKRFDVHEISDLQENENCEILGGFGPD